ncbi:hypothetical protein K7W42_01985 [Deinococcus sp. HMF7604]|uniref:hypothetical protein n=1 Tax=Deinococcus betulae TaxID=2873312 RepID=UPI001CCC35B2|nr:hypothetical protein [Deinococcus betulae]
MKSRILGPLLTLMVLLAGAAWWQSGARWRGALYCAEQPGQVWGVAPIPAGATLLCPESSSVRAEVRRGDTRIEQYLFADWQPETLLRLLEAEGFTRLSTRPDDGIQFEAVLTSGRERVLYIAEHRGEGTLVNLGGTPMR